MRGGSYSSANSLLGILHQETATPRPAQPNAAGPIFFMILGFVGIAFLVMIKDPILRAVGACSRAVDKATRQPVNPRKEPLIRTAVRDSEAGSGAQYQRATEHSTISAFTDPGAKTKSAKSSVRGAMSAADYEEL